MHLKNQNEKDKIIPGLPELLHPKSCHSIPITFFEPPLTIVYCAFQLFRTCDTKEETVSWSIDESPFLVAQLQI